MENKAELSDIGYEKYEKAKDELNKLTKGSIMQKKLESDYNLGRQVGINLRYFRSKKNFTQMDLAEAANITPYIVSNIESKPYYQVRASTLKDIADALEIDVCELICSLH